MAENKGQKVLTLPEFLEILREVHQAYIDLINKQVTIVIQNSPTFIATQQAHFRLMESEAWLVNAINTLENLQAQEGVAKVDTVQAKPKN